jgi:hypothetical protein
MTKLQPKQDTSAIQAKQETIPATQTVGIPVTKKSVPAGIPGVEVEEQSRKTLHAHVIIMFPKSFPYYED